MVRLLVTSTILDETTWAGSCPAWVDKPDLATFRQQALAEGWNDPGMVLNSYLLDCIRPQPRSWCDREAMQVHMQSLEPENAVTYLMPLLRPLPVIEDNDPAAMAPGTGPGAADERATPDPQIIQAAILRAARSQRFDTHASDGIFDLFLEARRLAELNPPPTQNPELAALLGSQGLAWPTDMAEIVTLNNIGILSTGFVLSNPVPEYCQQAHTDQDAGLLQACLDLSRLMQATSNSLAGKMIGHSMEISLSRPEGTPRTRDIRDWRYRIWDLVRRCESPKKLGSWPLDEGLPQDHAEQYFRDMQTLGWHHANRRAAEREYAAFPEAFAIDPAKCQGALTLDDHLQEDLVELDCRQSSNETGNAGPSLKMLAELLDQ